MTDSLGVLLSKSWKAFTGNIIHFLVMSIVVGIAMGSMQFFLMNNIQNTAFPGATGMNMEQMQELAERAQQDDEEALSQLMAQAEGIEGSTSIIADVLPGIFLYGLVIFLLAAIANTYFYTVATDSSLSIGAALARTPKLVLPLIGVWVWSFLRSFAWIPFIGIIFGIIIGPRLILAPAILIGEKKGVIGSVRESYQRSTNYWGKIFGSCFAMAILVWICSIVISIPLGMALDVTTSPVLLLGANSVVTMCLTAFWTVFVVSLTQTITANPKATA